MLDDGFIWGYLFGRYEDGIAGLLARLNRRTRGALAAFSIGFCLSIVPAYFLFHSHYILWAALGVAVACVLATWIVRALFVSGRSHGSTMRMQPYQRTRLTDDARDGE